MIDILQKTNEDLRSEKEDLQEKIVGLDDPSFAFDSLVNNQPAEIEKTDAGMQTDSVQPLGDSNSSFHEIGNLE